MTDPNIYDESFYQQLKTDVMTQTIVQLYVDRYVDDKTAIRGLMTPSDEPLSAVEVYRIRQEAMDQFNEWLNAIKEQG